MTMNSETSNNEIKIQDLENQSEIPNKLKGGKNYSCLSKFFCCFGNLSFLIGIISFVVWWVYAVSDILPALRDSFGSNPGDWSLAFYIGISILPVTFSFIFFFAGIFSFFQGDKIGRSGGLICTMIGVSIITIWFVLGDFFIVKPLENSNRSNPGDWSLAFFVILSVIFTSISIFICCFGAGYMCSADDGCMNCGD